MKRHNIQTYLAIVVGLLAINIFIVDKTFAAPPSVPDIGGTIWIFPGGTTANVVRSVDPEGQNIMYDIDWDGNGTVDGTTGYFASGVNVNIGIVAPTLAPQVKARARDTAGEVSAWSGAFEIETNYSCEWGYGSNPKGRVFGTAILGQPVDVMIANCYNNPASFGYDFGGGTWQTPTLPYTGSLLDGGSGAVRVVYPGTGPYIISMNRMDQYGNDIGLGYVPVIDVAPVAAVNGTCGSSNGGNFSSAPTTNLCSSGTNSPVTGSGPWNWGCYGNYAQAVSCNASIITSYNCEAGTFNPGLSILTNNSSSVIGFAINAATRIYHSVFGGACFFNNSGLNYFIPTKTSLELNSFISNLPAGVSKANGGW
jgi:hypothetical protein